MPVDPLKCLEFFAGIGGFHFSLQKVCSNFEVLAAFDINTVTNSIYRANFQDTNLLQRNIQALSAEYLDKFCADLWLLSPPCQPFTRRGVKKDLKDRRCDGFKSLCTQLGLMKNPPRYLILENVCGFEKSDAHDFFCGTLTGARFAFEEFILSPLQIGIPNSRPRYYLLARRDSETADFKGELCTEFPKELGLDRFRTCSVAEFIENNVDDCTNDLNLSTLAQTISGLDLVASPSKQTACFTKSYSVYLKGSGSLLVTAPELQTEAPKEQILKLLESANELEKQALISSFGLRFFTWREVASLLGFPKSFTKPKEISNKQMYHAFGNSISIYVVSALLKYLLRNNSIIKSTF
uniref:tRNA (Cytosine(38)-C(5))-methyltransferase n=1 Tax=Syphacia muris TaxID=451379 RepID=A0A0N5ADS5_9BILA